METRWRERMVGVVAERMMWGWEWEWDAGVAKTMYGVSVRGAAEIYAAESIGTV